MPREVELKLEIASNDIEAVIATAARIGAVVGTKTLRSVYFDTDDHALSKAGLSLRVRHDGDHRIQTVKAEQGKPVGLYDRDEWECGINSDTPVLAPESPVSEVLGGRGAERIAPLFQSKVERTTAHVMASGSEIELIIDRGEVAAEDRSMPVCEVELELKHGTPADLFALARQLDAAVPGRLGVLTKAERGYRLLGRQGLGTARAEPVALEPTMTAATAF